MSTEAGCSKICSWKFSKFLIPGVFKSFQSLIIPVPKEGTVSITSYFLNKEMVKINDEYNLTVVEVEAEEISGIRKV